MTIDGGPPLAGDMALFQEQAKDVLDYIETHFRGLSEAPVKPTLKPGDLAASFPEEAPRSPVDFSGIMNDLGSKIAPGLTHWQHPKFLSYYPSASSVPAILGELLVAAFGSVGLQWSANPIGTELECVVMDWIGKMIHAPADSPFLHSSNKGGGLIQNTAGESLVVVMTAAKLLKHKKASPELAKTKRDALFYQDSSSFVIYMSDHSHFSGIKAVRVAGMRVHIIPAVKLSNGNYGITASMVAAAMKEDRQAGLIPCGVQLNYGSTNTCGFDEIESFHGFSGEHDVWVHVDAAYAGASWILPRFRQQARCVQDISDSFNFNGSKWFLCGFDSAFLYVKDRRDLTDVFSATGDYLDSRGGDSPYCPEFKDWSIPLGRRFRSLRIWLVLQYFGQEGIRRYLETAIHQADWLRGKIAASHKYNLVVTTNLGLVCFGLEHPESTNDFVEHIQKLGFLLYPSALEGEPIVRVALGGIRTSQEDVEGLWRAMDEYSLAT